MTTFTFQIFDFNNGTYQIDFLAAWTGNATINIILVHPSDAVWFLEDVVWQTEDKIFWRAKFEKGNTTEITNCSLKSPGTWGSKMCAYPQPSANGRTAFVCGKPSQLPCGAIQSHTSDKERIKKRIAELCKDTGFLFEG